ncbi:MAG: peptidoglycan-binding protein [Pirellulaceae bacterium]
MSLRSPLFANQPRLDQAAQNRPPLRRGDRGTAVNRLQQALIACGLALPRSTRAGTPDGIYGDETVQKVSEFQTREGLAADGIAGRDTLHRLDDRLLGGGSDPSGPIPSTRGREFAATTARRAPF